MLRLVCGRLRVRFGLCFDVAKAFGFGSPAKLPWVVFD